MWFNIPPQPEPAARRGDTCPDYDVRRGYARQMPLLPLGARRGLCGIAPWRTPRIGVGGSPLGSAGTLSVVDGRGWDWPAPKIRRVHLVEWVVQRSAEEPDDVYVSLDSFYRALPDQSMNTYVIALDDVNSLERDSLIELANSFGSVVALAARSTPEGRAFADDLQATHSNTQRRRSACRDAMVDWLYSRDAVNPPGADRDKMLQDQRGYFFAEPFTANDLDAAAAWLSRQGLVGGGTIDEAQGPVVLYLTDSGVKCVEDFSSDTGAYLERQQHRASGPTVNIGTNNAPFQVAGDYARQVQNIGISANDLRQQISEITTIVRALVPDVPDADAEEQAALAAVSDQGVDQSALERFRAWTVNTVRTGTNAAAVAAVSSATTTLLIEAARLASHLG